jgi:segregation and condensation protein A
MEQVVSHHVVAIVDGKHITEIPADLFIPPDALEVLLDTFSGPLDLLLYLIRKQNLDILNIPMQMISKQYMHYIELMKEKRLELAVDYLVMAALLAEIKSRLLLPPDPLANSEILDEDPRLTLVRRLQAYEQFKEAAIRLDKLPRCNRDFFPAQIDCSTLDIMKSYPEVELNDLRNAYMQIYDRQAKIVNHQITREAFSVRARMNTILQKLNQMQYANLTQLFTFHEGRAGLVVALLAILELSRLSLVSIVQIENDDPILVKAVVNE